MDVERFITYKVLKLFFFITEQGPKYAVCPEKLILGKPNI
jgi:hypothetical protein